MSAQLNDLLLAERLGIVGNITVGDILGLVPKPFLPAPDLYDETTDYFYMGWEDVNGSWLVRRTLRLDSTKLDATDSGNIHDDIASAWPDRESLVYGAL